LKCDVGIGIFSCIVQHAKFKQGLVISYNSFNKQLFIKPQKIMADDEMMSNNVDWLMVHCAGNCVNTMEELEPVLYKKYKEEFSK